MGTEQLCSRCMMCCKEQKKQYMNMTACSGFKPQHYPSYNQSFYVTGNNMDESTKKIFVGILALFFLIAVLYILAAIGFFG